MATGYYQVGHAVVQSGAVHQRGIGRPHRSGTSSSALGRALHPSGFVERPHGVVQLQRERRGGISVSDDFDINAGLGFGGRRHCLVQFRAGRHPRRHPIVTTESMRKIGIVPGRGVIVGDGGIFTEQTFDQL